ncbi:MAG: BatA domain-containing protein [Rhodopirellula sp.]|nr:BatA domain-containing protein [Rhodopirellula sp.]
MTFLQPLLLAALPLIALPVIIHLINQRRYQSVRWGAMMFLLAANRMSRGYARIRQILILIFRTLAIAGLIFAVSRPLASGWLGLTAGGKADTTIILLDRSPSMQEQGAGTGVSKLQAGREQLASTLETLGSDRWVLVQTTSADAIEIESPDSLRKLPSTEPVGTSSDLPGMLEKARDYIHANNTGQTEVWICSDIRENDWNAESGRWQTIRDSFLELPQTVRFHLLAYPTEASSNTSIRVTNVRRFETVDNAELLVSLKVTRDASKEDRVTLPIQFEIEGARSELTVEIDGPTLELIDHHLPIERSNERGWGKVSIPADSNSADNDFYFVFDRPRQRHTLIVSNDPQTAVPLQLAASISPDSTTECSAETLSQEQLASVDWETVSLVLWHAPFPDQETATTLTDYINRGGQIVFLPPREPGSSQFMNVRWNSWSDQQTPISVETWRGDQGILANSQSGTALPVGELQVRRYCGLEGELTPLARLKNNQTLFAHLPTTRGGVYFCATTPDLKDSSLTTNGVVLYVFIQRALATGAASLGQTQQLTSGAATSEPPVNWKQIIGPENALSTDYVNQSGIYSEGEKLLAVNRRNAEDLARVLDDDRLAGLFNGLSFSRVDDNAGSFEGLIQEVWRMFLVAMLIALIVEAMLCMPRVIPRVEASGFPRRQADGDLPNDRTATTQATSTTI